MAVMAVVVVVGTDRIWEGIVCRMSPPRCLVARFRGVERSQRLKGLEFSGACCGIAVQLRRATYRGHQGVEGTCFETVFCLISQKPCTLSVITEFGSVRTV